MRKRTLTILTAFLAGALFAGCGHSSGVAGGGTAAPTLSAPSSNGTNAAISASGDADLRGQSPPLLPDPQKTPGATLPVTKDDICVPGYSKKVRNVPQSVKEQVYADYGITSRQPGEYEVDHLISLELGGSNSARNLWPQSYKTQPWNAHVKDQLENELHDEVCSDKIDLPTAQHDIATDWIAAYKRYFHTDGPLSASGASYHHHSTQHSTRQSEGFVPNGVSNNGGGGGQVWVNTRSGKYWEPGTEYYGKTKQGQYMSRSQAEQQGYTPAKGQ